AIVESEMADEKKRLLQDMSLDRALQIKKADPDLLKVALVDIKMLFSQLNDSIFTKNSEDFLNILHGIKGNARLVGFKQLLKMTHSLESKLREHKEFDWKIVFAHVDELRNEWREILSLANVLKPIEDERNEKPEDEDAKAPNVSLYQDFTTLLEKLGPLTEIDLLESYIDVANRIKNLSFKPISGLENSLRIGVQKTADSVGKKVKLFFDWGDKIALDEVDLINIRTCLMHMTNNAIDHGLESVEERTAKQKPPFGNVQIRAIRGGDRLFISVQDDGKGINLEAVKKKAIANGLTTADQAAKLSDEEIVNFLFAQGFSTAEKVTDLSGRGVGMAAVADIVHKYHGEIKMYNSQQGGAVTEFYIYVPMNEFLEV
ncbi:MAG TPA: ATP-binding protein, partial [Pseudobdellovibrionaceae bacterium]|nr:ATP-binding protein [Pseudobdellovibrionaceae bacterium]